MVPLQEYTYIINYHFIGVVTTGTMLAAIVFFSIFYYFYIEKTPMIGYTGFYLSTVLVGLLSSSLLILSILGQIDQFNQRSFYRIDLVIDYLNFFAVYIMFLHLLHRPEKSLRIVPVFMLIVFENLGEVYEMHWLFIFLYLYILMGILILFTLSEMTRRYKSELGLFLCIYASIIIYYTLHHDFSFQGIPFSSYEWITVLFIVVGTIVYYMYNYSLLLKDKERLLNILTHDHLTGLFSKSFFAEQLSMAEKGIVLFIDVNHLKNVNDELGHLVGDELLKQFGEYLLERTNDDMLPSRFGGDEVTILLTSKNLEAAQILAYDLMNKFKDILFFLEFHDHDVGINIGIANFTRYRGDEAVANADNAMYLSKRNGTYELGIHLQEGDI